MFTQEQLKSMHCGLIGCHELLVDLVMPEVLPVLDTCPVDFENEDWYVDVKVHMLMPDQFPCIPNWHYDFVPRDPDTGQQDFSLVDPSQKMYLWLSGPPFTEFRDGRPVEAGKWVEFTQNDEHRGTVSTDHQWRMFIRVYPKALRPASLPKLPVLRRHSQVYLDSDKFKW